MKGVIFMFNSTRKAKKRSNNEGSIYFDSNRKTWVAALVDPSGKRLVKRNKSFDVLDTWRTTMKASFINNSYIPPSNITLGAWIIEWLETYVAPTVRVKTLIRYKETATKLEPIAGVKLQDVSIPMVQKFLNNLPVMSPSSKRKVYIQLSASFKKALILGLVNRNPMDSIIKPKLKHTDVEIFTWIEMRKILGKISLPDSQFKHWYPFILLIATTGMRLGEASGLKSKDFNKSKGTIKIDRNLQYIGKSVPDKFIENPPKTEAGYREIALPEETIAVIDKLLQKRNLLDFNGNDYIFLSKNGRPLSPSNVNTSWHRILKYCEVPYRSIHKLRHTHATELLAAGIPLIEVSKRLGHGDPSITLKVYGHAIKGYDKQTLSKIKEIYAI